MEEVQILNQCFQQYPSRFWIQPLDGLIDKVGVQQAELVQIRRSWVEHVVVDPTNIRPRPNGMRSDDLFKTFGASRSVRAEETVWHAAVLEEPLGGDEVQLPGIRARLTPVNKEVDWEGRLCVGCEDTRSDEGKLWVGSDRLLDALPP